MDVDVAVVGGGVIGLAVACELACADRAVAVVDAGRCGGGATRAAGGILSPTDRHEWHGDLGDLNRRSLAMWPAWLAGLEAEAGLSAGYRPAAEVRVARDSDGLQALADARDGADRWGLAATPLNWERCRERAPWLAQRGRAGLLVEGVASVDPDGLVAVLAAAARARGVRLVEGVRVAAEHLTARGGLAVGGAPPVRAAVAILAGGAWMGQAWVPGGARLPVRPVLGEGIVVRPEGRMAPDAPVVRTATGSIVPRRDGRVWIGTTLAECGFRTQPRLEGVGQIVSAALEVAPGLAAAAFIEVRAGLRPISDGGGPRVVGHSSGAICVGGHGREGLIQAPVTAWAVARGVVHGRWDGIPAAFRGGTLADGA